MLKAILKAKSPLIEWLTAIKTVDWEVPNDIKQTFRSADLLGKGSDRILFDIGGNNYRMIRKYAFGEKQIHLFICWIGSHPEYDKINKAKEQYTINLY